MYLSEKWKCARLRSGVEHWNLYDPQNQLKLEATTFQHVSIWMEEWQEMNALQSLNSLYTTYLYLNMSLVGKQPHDRGHWGNKWYPNYSAYQKIKHHEKKFSSFWRKTYLKIIRKNNLTFQVIVPPLICPSQKIRVQPKDVGVPTSSMVVEE